MRIGRSLGRLASVLVLALGAALMAPSAAPAAGDGVPWGAATQPCRDAFKAKQSDWEAVCRRSADAPDASEDDRVIYALALKTINAPERALAEINRVIGTTRPVPRPWAMARANIELTLDHPIAALASLHAIVPSSPDEATELEKAKQYIVTEWIHDPLKRLTNLSPPLDTICQDEFSGYKTAEELEYREPDPRDGIRYRLERCLDGYKSNRKDVADTAKGLAAVQRECQGVADPAAAKLCADNRPRIAEVLERDRQLGALLERDELPAALIDRAVETDRRAFVAGADGFLANALKYLDPADVAKWPSLIAAGRTYTVAGECSSIAVPLPRTAAERRALDQAIENVVDKEARARGQFRITGVPPHIRYQSCLSEVASQERAQSDRQLTDVLHEIDEHRNRLANYRPYRCAVNAQPGCVTDATYAAAEQRIPSSLFAAADQLRARRAPAQQEAEAQLAAWKKVMDADR